MVRDTHRRALVYGDIDLNLIDGSAIWVQSIAQALSQAGCAVTLVLKNPSRTPRLLAPLLADPRVMVRRPFEEGLLEGLTGTGMSAVQASHLLAALDSEHSHDLLVLRGRRIAEQVAADGKFDGRLWTYLTDIPQSAAELDGDAVAGLTRIARASRYLLCQTEELRCFLESSVPAACGKCELLRPVVPPLEVPPRDVPHDVLPAGQAGLLRLVYTGKFAPRWNTYEMTQLPRLLAAEGVRAEIHLVGDKVHDDPADPGYGRRMRAALGTVAALDARVPPNGVAWHGGRPRQEAMRIAAACDVGLGWRHPALDASLELSTKVLEFGSLGLPVVLNRTPMHEALLGADYPLFAASRADVVEALAAYAADAEVGKLAAARAAAAAAQFSLERVVACLRELLGGLNPGGAASSGDGQEPAGAPRSARPGAAPPSAPVALLKVAVAGHDLKFFTRILEYLRSMPGLDVRLDHWPGLAEHDEAVSGALARWADVVICEWCGPNAIWYSRHKRRGSRLLVRIHRFELYSRYVHDVDIAAVDQVVCVSPHYARLAGELAGWPASKVVTVPNWVDLAQLDRPKLEGARHHLGIVGMVPARKRLDLALDVLADLRATDERYMLYVKSTMPWDHWWIWKQATERGHYADAAYRIARDPLLRGGVVFDPAGPDVAAWLRRVGFVLSTSDDESFHVAPAEGMASRAVPVVRNWPGAQTIYNPQWIHPTPAAMAASIGAMTPGQWVRAGELARQQAQPFGINAVGAAWHGLLTGDLPPAAAEPRFELLGTV